MRFPHHVNILSSVYTFLLMLVVVHHPSKLVAQQYGFSHLTVNDGLAQSSVYGIYQDKQGFMWFGTSDGLNRFDGSSMRTYKHQPNERLRGTGNFYGKNAVEDEAGNIYFSGRTGMAFYHRKQDAIYRFYPNNDTLRFDNFIQILSLRNDTLWFTDSHKYFYAYHIPSKHIKQYTAQAYNGKPNFFHAEMDKWGRIWFSTEQGVGCFNIHNQRTTFHLQALFRSYGLTLFNDVFAVNEHKIIISAYYFIVEYDVLRNTYKMLLPTSKNESYDRVLQSRDGTLYVGSMSSGLWIKRPSGNIEHLMHHESEEQSPGSNIVIGMCLDRTGNLWLGCDGAGITRMNTQPSNFNLYRRGFKQSYQFATDFIKCFYADTDKIWFGTHEGGLHELDRKTQFTRVYRFSWPGSNTIASIYKYNNHIFLLGTGAGVVLFDSRIGKGIIIKSNTPILTLDGQNFVHALVRTQSGRYWVAARGGIFSFTEKAGKFTPMAADTLCGKPYIVSICQTRDGKIWAGNLEYGYVYRFAEQKNGKLKLIDTLLKGNIIRSFFEDTLTNTLWMASEKGLIKYNLTSDKYQLISTKDGLKDNYLYAVVPGIKDQLWLSSNHGLMCYHTQTKQVDWYTVDDGLQSNEFNTGCYFRSAEGELFFGGINGFNSFYPQQIARNTRVPLVVLTKFMVNDEEYSEAGNPAVLNSIALSHKLNTLSFEFAALEYTCAKRNQYQYRLEEVDQNWVFSGTRHFARYSSLAPGYYKLWVKACNNDGVWSEPKLLLTIHIKTPWWKQWWMLVLEITTLAVGAYFIIRYVSTRKLKERIRQMEAVNQERIRIAKDMHDDLGSGISKIAIMTQLLKSKQASDTDIQRQIDKIEHTAHELVDNMGQIVWTMNASNDSLENFLAYVREYVYDFLDGTAINVVVDFEEPEEEIEMGQQLRRNLFLVIKETLNNTVKHAQASEVRIGFSINKHEANFYIKDNGRGFDPTSTRRFGNGLANMSKRLIAVGASYEINSNVGNGTQTKLTWKTRNT